MSALRRQGSEGHARRWLLRFFALFLVLILGWFGWEQWQLIQRQAAAPVVSVAEDGTVRVNGREIIIGPDGLPPKVLEEVEGGPPVEEVWTPVEKPSEVEVAMRPLQKWLPGGAYAERVWQYRRTGLHLLVMRRLENGAARYLGDLDLWGVKGCWLELRGQRWWLGRPGPLGPLRQSQLAASLRTGFAEDASVGGWVLQAGGTRVSLHFQRHSPLRWLRSEWLSHLSLAGVTLRLAPVYDLTGTRGW